MAWIEKVGVASLPIRLSSRGVAQVVPKIAFRSLLLATSNGKEELEFWGKLVFGVEPVREVNPSNTAVGMDLHSIQRIELEFARS